MASQGRWLPGPLCAHPVQAVAGHVPWGTQLQEVEDEGGWAAQGGAAALPGSGSLPEFTVRT